MPGCATASQADLTAQGAADEQEKALKDALSNVKKNAYFMRKAMVRWRQASSARR